jgi:hypothetical protein
MRHPKTPIALRIKVGVITAPYVHPKKSNKPKAPGKMTFKLLWLLVALAQ